MELTSRGNAQNAAGGGIAQFPHDSPAHLALLLFDALLL